MIDKNGVSRGTRCLGAYKGVDCKGAYPAGYLKFLKSMGWWGEKRIHLCSGAVKDEGGFKVDIRPEMKPDLVADARDTKLPEGTYDCVLIDPPYSRELAKSLYGTQEYYSRIDDFNKEGVRLARAGGFIVSLSYNIPKLQKECDLTAVWGIYEVPSVSSMRCLVVFKKKHGFSMVFDEQKASRNPGSFCEECCHNREAHTFGKCAVCTCKGFVEKKKEGI